MLPNPFPPAPDDIPDSESGIRHWYVLFMSVEDMAHYQPAVSENAACLELAISADQYIADGYIAHSRNGRFYEFVKGPVTVQMAVVWRSHPIQANLFMF
jgi:hypothetical protein